MELGGLALLGAFDLCCLCCVCAGVCAAVALTSAPTSPAQAAACRSAVRVNLLLGDYVCVLAPAPLPLRPCAPTPLRRTPRHATPRHAHPRPHPCCGAGPRRPLQPPAPTRARSPLVNVPRPLLCAVAARRATRTWPTRRPSTRQPTSAPPSPGRRCSLVARQRRTHPPTCLCRWLSSSRSGRRSSQRPLPSLSYHRSVGRSSQAVARVRQSRCDTPRSAPGPAVQQCQWGARPRRCLYSLL
jgi:hypothetical protein